MLSDATYIAMFMCYLNVIYIMQLVIPKSKNYGHMLSKFFLGENNISPLEKTRL